MSADTIREAPLAKEVIARDLSDPWWPGLTESDWAMDAKRLALQVLELLAALDALEAERDKLQQASGHSSSSYTR